MTLAFHQLFPAELPLIGNQKTFFVFKIKKAIQRELAKYDQRILFNHGQIGDNLMMAVTPKLHTIRKDEHNRWKAGNEIHFVINDRTRNREQFLPPVKCVSTQRIDITYPFAHASHLLPMVLVDNRMLTAEEVKLLAINDGFTSLEEFFAYFNTHFTGKIIHWTHLKY